MDGATCRVLMGEAEADCLQGVEPQGLVEKMTQHEVQVRELLLKLHLEHEQRIERKVDDAVHHAIGSALASRPDGRLLLPAPVPQRAITPKQLPGTVCSSVATAGISGDEYMNTRLTDKILPVPFKKEMIENK